VVVKRDDPGAFPRRFFGTSTKAGTRTSGVVVEGDPLLEVVAPVDARDDFGARVAAWRGVVQQLQELLPRARLPRRNVGEPRLAGTRAENSPATAWLFTKG
jgi:hypothetical protein